MAETHTVKRAIIMAAGIGKRMQPLYQQRTAAGQQTGLEGS